MVLAFAVSLFLAAGAAAQSAYMPPAKQARAEIKWAKPICAGSVTCLAGVAIDRSADRVKTNLDVGFKRIGTLVPRGVDEIGESGFMVGCETLDRGFADFDAYKEYLPPLGISKIRIQAGWARCEREKGVFDSLRTPARRARSRSNTGGGSWTVRSGSTPYA